MYAWQQAVSSTHTPSGLEYHLGLLNGHAELLVVVLGKILVEQTGERTTGEAGLLLGALQKHQLRTSTQH